MMMFGGRSSTGAEETLLAARSTRAIAGRNRTATIVFVSVIFISGNDVYAIGARFLGQLIMAWARIGSIKIRVNVVIRRLCWYCRLWTLLPPWQTGLLIGRVFDWPR